jgi:hypothetical protein
MKKLILFLTLLVATSANAQLFNNVNSELCCMLYERSDAAGAYRVYVVVDKENFEEKDYKILEKWESLNQTERSRVAQRWAIEGKRIESERAPYITYPPVIPKTGTAPRMRRDLPPNPQWLKQQN